MRKSPTGTTRFKACALFGCENNAHRDASGKRGWCAAHYQRWRRYGDPSAKPGVPRPAIDWIEQHVLFDGNDCLPWPFALGADGYGRAHIPETGAVTTASRLMCRMAHGEPISPSMEAAHSCGKGHNGCVNPRHLYWASPKANHADKVGHGTTNRGTRQWSAKLTEDDIHEIRRLLGSMSQKSIADRFCVDPSLISDIKRGKKWGWLSSR